MLYRVVSRFLARLFFYGSIAHTTGRLPRTTVQGNCLFKVMGQETCQQNNRERKGVKERERNRKGEKETQTDRQGQIEKSQQSSTMIALASEHRLQD